MDRFVAGQRVIVKQTEQGIAVNTPGTVWRICTDGTAWVTLDERHKQVGARVRVPAANCELAQGNAKERRVAARAPAELTLESFGRDHWSTFAYIETRAVDHRGLLDKRHLRCSHARHPFFAHEGGDAAKYPTRLKGAALLSDHDDWDCADDLEREGLIENIGTGVNRRYRVTEAGSIVAAALRVHKAAGGSFDAFDVTPLLGTVRSRPDSPPATTAASCRPAAR